MTSLAINPLRTHRDPSVTSCVESAPAIEVSGLTVDRAEVRALEDVSITVPTGAVSVLLGPNGSGKSTLLLSLLGLLPATGGTVRLFGRPVRRALRAGMVASVPQADDVDRNFPVTAAEVVMQGRRPMIGALRRPGRVDRLAVDEALGRVGMADFADRGIGALSGGQRRRIFLARCIAQEASLLLLDEPFAGVDATSESVLIDLLRQLAAEGRSTLVSTHHLDTVETLADEVILLNGRVVATGEPEATMTSDHLASLLGTRTGGWTQAS